MLPQLALLSGAKNRKWPCFFSETATITRFFTLKTRGKGALTGHPPGQDPGQVHQKSAE